MYRPLAVSLAFFAAPAIAQEPSEAPPDCGLYTYRVDIVRVIDGDTVVADIDLGFHIWIHDERLRLAGVDTPEMDTEDGVRIAEEVRARIEGRTLYICTVKMKRSDREAVGKYGRFLATVYEGAENVNQWLLDTGRAVPDE